MNVKDRNFWVPKWSTPTRSLVTIEERCEELNAILWMDSSFKKFPKLDDKGIKELNQLLGQPASSVLVAVADPDSTEAIRSQFEHRETSIQFADLELPCPLDLSKATDSPSPRRWVSLFAAHRAYGGSCCVIECEEAVTLDLIDEADCMREGVTLDSLPDDPMEFSHSLDREIVSFVEGHGANGPLLVITGMNANTFIENGKMPVQHVPELVHRGLVELWHQNHDE